MDSDLMRVGRIAGILLLAQAMIAIPVYTSAGMMGSITNSRFLSIAAPDASMIQIGLMLTLLLSAISVAVALAVMPAFRRASERMFWLFFLLTAVGVALTVAENAVIREMVTMSINSTKGGTAEIYNALAPAVRSEWESLRFSILTLGHMKALLFFLILFRFRYVPRALAGIGVLATVASTTGAMAAIGGVPFSYFMVGPAALVQLATTLWLIWKGFAEPARRDPLNGKGSLETSSPA